MKYDPVDRTSGCPYIIILWSKNNTEEQQQVAFYQVTSIYIYLLLASSLYGVSTRRGGGWAGVRRGGRHDKLAEAAQLLLLPILCPPRLQNTTR